MSFKQFIYYLNLIKCLNLKFSMSDNSYNEDSFENDNNKEEIFDSLNINSNKNKQQNNNVSINNNDSALEEAFESLTKISKGNKGDENKKKENFQNNNSYEENDKKIENEKDEENVNLGNSFSKISERDKINNNIKQENNNISNKEVLTPNTSINNISESIPKQNGQENNNNIEITEKNLDNIINKNNDNKNNEELQNMEQINKKETSNIFEDESLIYHKKANLSVLKNSFNPNKDENSLLYNINIHFSKIGKPNDNENNLVKENNNLEEHFINLTDKDIKNNNKKKRTKNMILKRFEQIKKNENNKINIQTSNSLKLNSENNIIINNENEQENSKILNNFMTNETKESREYNYIYLCPFCNKETPEIKKIEGIQTDPQSPTIDKISLLCKCGTHELTLDEFVQKVEQQNEFNNLKDFCYNENHDYIKGVSFCSKCDKWFCEKCLLYHKSLLSDHLITPVKIPKNFPCPQHSKNILFFCTNCDIGICEKCKSEYHYDHYLISIDDYFNRTYKSLPFKSFDELYEFIEHCNRISEKAKNSYVKYIDDMINKLNDLKTSIIENYNISKNRRLTQQKLIKYLFGNFICFNENFMQMKNMNSINFICPYLFLNNDINFIKAANNYSLFLKKESFIEINQDKKLNKDQLNIIFEKYKSMFKEKKPVQNEINNYNSNKIYLETLQSESNYIYPTLFKIYNKTGIYYGEIENNKRNGIGKQFNNNNEYEGIWKNGEILKGKSIYYTEQGNIIYEGEFKDGIEHGYGVKIYPDKRIYKGNFINGKIDAKYEIQKKLEIE